MSLLVEAGRVSLGWLIDRGVETLGGKLPAFDKQLPSPGDGFLLEIIPEGPVPEHLEKGVVVGIEAHILKVVMLPAGTDALLRVGSPGRRVGAGGGTKENRHELIHPRISEKQVRGVG